MDKADGAVVVGRYGRRVAEVLIIEDDDRIRPLLVRGLRDCGHTVTSAPTGMGGLQLAVDSSPDLVVLDLGLPDVDGVKPFTSAQLDARVRAVLRRTSAGRERPATLVVGGLSVDLTGRRVHLDGTEVALTPREFDLLAHLAARPGEAVTTRDLLVEVWRQPWGGSDKTVDLHLSWLRRKLGETAAEPRYLTTVRGVGVRLTAPPDPGQGG